MGVCASLAACLCFLVCLCLLCFEANKYDDDDDDIYSSEWWMHRAWRIPCIEEALCIIEMTLSLCTVHAPVALYTFTISTPHCCMCLQRYMLHVCVDRQPMVTFCAIYSAFIYKQ